MSIRRLISALAISLLVAPLWTGTGRCTGFYRFIFDGTSNYQGLYPEMDVVSGVIVTEGDTMTGLSGITSRFGAIVQLLPADSFGNANRFFFRFAPNYFSSFAFLTDAGVRMLIFLDADDGGLYIGANDLRTDSAIGLFRDVSSGTFTAWDIDEPAHFGLGLLLAAAFYTVCQPIPRRRQGEGHGIRNPSAPGLDPVA